LNKNWKFKNLNDDGSSIEEFNNLTNEIRALKTKVQLPDLIIKLLCLRGITNYAKTVKFFRPTKEKLYDPFLLKDCKVAAERLIQAIDGKEKIMLLGDYDVDGTCGVSMFYLFLKKFGLDSCCVYIPDRITEGYGISLKSIDTAVEEGIKLVVSIDCGITAADKIEYAKSKGVEFIICDHHQSPDNIPQALAVIDPVRRDCEYPFKALCGTGVAFKLMQAISILKGQPDLPNSLLDFVAIATASDIVSLRDENRILVAEGFNILNTNPRPAFRVLVESSGLEIGKLNTNNIIYTIAPRINAVGRLGDAKRAVQLLTSDSEQDVQEFADVLNSENVNRREIDKTITDTAFKMFEDADEDEYKNAIVLHNDSWHPGVIGIVAARLVEKYNMPSIVLTTVNGVAKGSARSINGFNIYEALKKCDNLLVQYGGHFHAAGLEIEVAKIDEFKRTFNEVAVHELTEEQLIPEIEVDSEIGFDEIEERLVKILSFFEPFGPGNTLPVFTTKKVQIVGEIKHAKYFTTLFKLKDDNGNVFEAVFFNSNDYKPQIVEGAYCDVCYNIEKSEWRGYSKIKLKIKDMKFY
jgi:single-stranded-DNA-specific exonuclease